MSLFQGFASTPAASASTSQPPTLTAPSLFSSSSAAPSPFSLTSSASNTTTSSLYPSLATSAATSTAPTSGLFSTAPSTLSTGSLFANSSASTASSTLNNAAGKPAFPIGTTTANAVALTSETIAGSTKYMELPADAKTALDQFHTFLQGQIHLSTTLTTRPSDALDKISKDTDELAKRLSTLNDALDRDSKVIQALQDKVGQELKQADSAGRIIEAYTKTFHANFLYAGNNSAGQYFLDQCQSFEEQLRQFRSTIEEIERHLASYAAKNPQVPHALTEVMRDQSGAFLSVATHVANLHEEIKDKEKAYLLFRRKYFDDETDPFEASNKHRKLDGTHSPQKLHGGHLADGQKSFREIAKETLRPGSVAANAGTAPTMAAGSGMGPGSSSLFKPSPFSTSAAPSLSLTAAPTTLAPLTFGAAAPATTSLFGAAVPAAASPFGAAAPNTATPFGAPSASSGFGFGGFKMGK